MTPERADDIRSQERSAIFENARHLARTRGLPSYEDWRNHQERRYERMPSWWYDRGACEANYIAHIDAAIKWEAEQAQINESNREAAIRLGETLRGDGG